MWALAEMVRRVERRRWRKLFGTEFTGQSEGRRVELRWHECTVGHVCVGDVDPFLDGHLRCMKLTRMEWRFVRSKA